MSECEMCRESQELPEILGRTRFDFRRDCCRAQFLLRLKTKKARHGWLARFEQQYGEAAKEAAAFALVGLWGRVHGKTT